MLRLTLLGFALSFAIALVVVARAEARAGWSTRRCWSRSSSARPRSACSCRCSRTPGEISSTFGQLIIAAASIADFGAIILLSIFFSGEGGTGSTLLLLGALFVLAATVFFVVRGAERSMRDPRRPAAPAGHDRADPRPRARSCCSSASPPLAETLGLEAILGAFIAGAIVSLVDRDQAMTHPEFRRKLEAVGFGFFIPVFFVTSGVRFDLDALTASASNLLMVPIFLRRAARRARPAGARSTAARSTRATPRSPG